MTNKIKIGSLVKIRLVTRKPYSFPVHNPHAMPAIDPPLALVRHGQIGLLVEHVELEPVEGMIGYNDEYSQFLNSYEVVLVDEVLIEIKDACLEPL